MLCHLASLYQVKKQIFSQVFEFQEDKTFDKKTPRFLVSPLQLGDSMQPSA